MTLTVGEKLPAATLLKIGANGPEAVDLAALTAGRKVLVVIERDDELAQKSVRNLKDLHVITPDQLNAYDVLVSDDIVFTKSAYETFVASKTKKEEVER